MQTHFIYRPKSGDRVFFESPGEGIRVTKWQNGCRHVQGGVFFRWSTQLAPKGSWRPLAKLVLQSLMSPIGGIAWDEQGILYAVVPLRYAPQVYQGMLTASPILQEPSVWNYNGLMLCAVGLAWFEASPNEGLTLYVSAGASDPECLAQVEALAREPLPRYKDESPPREPQEEGEPYDWPCAGCRAQSNEEGNDRT